ncbi:MAG: AmmeMemoRadiSam system radical SAM enzyme [Anaerolineales bacterium]|nr:AmmeMemoRadiSam system radical SAM enzyme [Anaerolineales bacterium]
MATLQETLDSFTADAELAQTEEGGAVRCLACGHRCLVRPGRRGVCRVRFNRGGRLRMPWGYVAGLQADPVEKKPFYHLFPGASALTFGMLGCDFHCTFCQNWVSSQALRDPASEKMGLSIQRATPEEIAEAAVRTRSEVVVSSYNEPLITAEWAAAIFRRARARGCKTAIVSNGNATPEVLAYLRPLLDGMKIDLKAMRDATYRKLGGVLQNTLDTIQAARRSGMWVEVVTLLIPGLNDDPQELWDAARFLAGVSADIPWHVTAYHPDYQYSSSRPTNAADLTRAADIGQEAGLRYVYAGNLPGMVRELEDTVCPKCRRVLIRRRGFTILEYRLRDDGRCPDCGEILAGIWRDPGEILGKGRSPNPISI